MTEIPSSAGDSLEHSDRPMTQPIDVQLTVPSYSQMDERWGFEPGTERSMCGIVCVKAVADYYAERVGGAAPAPTELADEVRRMGGWGEVGISHAAEVNLLKAQGLLAWRRNWDAPDSDPQWLVDHEGYDPAQVAAVRLQQAAEDAVTTKPERELLAITEALTAQNPVIASVRAGYGGNQASHQVVIIGRQRDVAGDSLLVMDPERATGTNVLKDRTDHFLAYFNNRAIFVAPLT